MESIRISIDLKLRPFRLSTFMVALKAFIGRRKSFYYCFEILFQSYVINLREFCFSRICTVMAVIVEANKPKKKVPKVQI